MEPVFLVPVAHVCQTWQCLDALTGFALLTPLHNVMPTLLKQLCSTGEPMMNYKHGSGSIRNPQHRKGLPQGMRNRILLFTGQHTPIHSRRGVGMQHASVINAPETQCENARHVHNACICLASLSLSLALLWRSMIHANAVSACGHKASMVMRPACA
jgi:hypothetical protein